MYDIKIGDKFYHTNKTIQQGYNIPDYMEVTDIIYLGDHDEIDYIQAKYCNHYVDTRPRLFSSIILENSNLNPNMEKPDWIFSRRMTV